MTTETPDPFDTHLQDLFAGVQPAADFENRLIGAIRTRQRWTIPQPVRRAAIAAAAVLVVGGIGYYGNLAITGSSQVAFSRHGLQIDRTVDHAYAFAPAGGKREEFDFGGGSNLDQNRVAGNRIGQPTALPQAADLPSDKAARVPEPLPDVSRFKQTELTRESSVRDRSDLNRRTISDGDTSTESVLKNSAVQNGQHYFGGHVEGTGTLGVGGQLADRRSGAPTASELHIAGGTLQAVANLDRQAAASTDGKVAGEHTQFSDRDLSSGKIASGVNLSLDPHAVAAKPATEIATTAPIVDVRKIIRSGTMEFEVDRFDAAQAQISKIVGEAGGYVGTTDSTKLPNGKVRGTITLRVPPERLDTLVLSLRALGDLKSQQITAQDVSKEYTDTESELIADRAMQDRLLELIHSGKGSIKELLAAETELAVWRGKIEKAEGQIRYYNSLVSMSTLSITLSEKDIQTPAAAVETETADVGIEAEEVEKARDAALKSIDGVKGRIVEAELKRFDAGQLAARLVADVPPESAGAVIDQLKLLGKVARLEVQRHQTTSDGSPAVTGTTVLRTERKPTRLMVSIYNLANVAPRRTTHINLAAEDVEKTFAALIAEAKTDGGRVVTSNLDRGDPITATGSVTLELPPEKVDAAMASLHAQGEVLRLNSTENTDTQNSTEAKQGLTIQLVSLASVPARESIEQTIAATDVPAAYHTAQAAAETARARVVTAQLNEQDRRSMSGDLQLEVLRSELPALNKTLAGTGDTISRTTGRAANTDGTVDSKVRLRLLIMPAADLTPREKTRMQSEVTDVDKAAGDAQAIAVTVGGRVLDATVNKDQGKGSARVVIDVPLERSAETLRQLRGLGTVRGIDASRDTQAPNGPLAHAQIDIDFVTTDTLVTENTGPWSSIRQGLGTSINALLWSLKWIVVGLCLLGPFLLAGWLINKLRRHNTKKPHHP